MQLKAIYKLWCKSITKFLNSLQEKNANNSNFCRQIPGLPVTELTEVVLMQTLFPLFFLYTSSYLWSILTTSLLLYQYQHVIYTLLINPFINQQLRYSFSGILSLFCTYLVTFWTILRSTAIIKIRDDLNFVMFYHKSVFSERACTNLHVSVPMHRVG